MTTLQPTSNRFFAMADVHGEFDKLMFTMDLIKREADFDPLKDEFVQLGDKNDRGPKTFDVIEYFREMDLKYPDRFHMILGNHEDMLIDAAKIPRKDSSFWIPSNGGVQTLRSYSERTQLFGIASLGNSLAKTGHEAFIRKHYYFYETEDYFFSHAPIPQERYRSHPRGYDFRCHKSTLLWSYPGGHEESNWIDPNLIPKDDNKGCKLAVSGHIHGMYEKRVWKEDKDGKRPGPYKDILVVPGVRRYGNAVLLDTGCGCADIGYLSCLELPAMKVYDSRGQIYSI